MNPDYYTDFTTFCELQMKIAEVKKKSPYIYKHSVNQFDLNHNRIHKQQMFSNEQRGWKQIHAFETLSSITIIWMHTKKHHMLNKFLIILDCVVEKVGLNLYAIEIMDGL